MLPFPAHDDLIGNCRTFTLRTMGRKAVANWQILDQATNVIVFPRLILHNDTSLHFAARVGFFLEFFVEEGALRIRVSKALPNLWINF